MTTKGNTSLINREFIGTVLPDKDSIHQGKYKVNVPELQPHMKETEGIWCKNHTCQNRVTPSEDGIYGSYYPLHAGISVIVKFFANHIESAYIDRIISDAYAETLPYEIIERDDYYQIIRTPKHNNLIAIYEGDTDSQNVPKNSIHVYYNDIRTTIVIDEDGINVKTADNTNVIITKKCKVHVKETQDVHIEKATKVLIDETDDIHIVKATKVLIDDTLDVYVAKDTKVHSDKNIHVDAGASAYVTAASDIQAKAGGDANIEAGGDVNIKATGSLNLQAATINLTGAIVLQGTIDLNGAVKSKVLACNNSAVAASPGPASATPATPATPATVAVQAADAEDADEPTLIEPRKDYEYFTRKTGK